MSPPYYIHIWEFEWSVYIFRGPWPNSVGGVCCVYFRWLLVMVHVYILYDHKKKVDIYGRDLWQHNCSHVYSYVYLHQWSVVSKKVSSFFDVVIFDRYAKLWTQWQRSTCQLLLTQPVRYSSYILRRPQNCAKSSPYFCPM